MLLLVAVLCLIWGLAIGIYQVRIISKNKEIKLINLVNLMYAFVYGLLPAVILFRKATGVGNCTIDTSVAGMVKLIIILVMSIFVHFWLNIAYKGTKTKESPPVTSEKTTFRASWLMLIIGFVSLFLWTRAAGGIFEFIDIAPGIRAGYTKLSNPFGFLEHVTKILMLAACIMVSYWLQHKKKIWIILPAAVALYGAFLFIMAWDSRAAFGFMVLMIALVYIEYCVQNGKAQMKKALFYAAIIAAAAVILMVQSEGFAQEFRGNTYEEERSSNLFVIVEEEFGFILRVQQNVLDALLDPEFKMQLGNDLLNTITAWIPSRFIFFDQPDSLWKYTTQVVMNHHTYGTIPADFVSACLLELGVLGLLVIPLAMGWLLKKADGMLESETYNFYRSNVKAALATVIINKVSHFQLSSIALAIFYLIVGHLIVVFCRALENGGRLQMSSPQRLS